MSTKSRTLLGFVYKKLSVLKMNKGTNVNLKVASKAQIYLPTREILPDISNFEVLPNPIQSSSDKKEYKVIRLPNGLTACLVSDKALPNDLSDESDSTDSESEGDSESSSVSINSSDEGADTDESGRAAAMKKVSAIEEKMSAAALCVGVGSFSDPKDIPGLAHFLEHMVFMGSEKYPGENDFDSFIKKRGGTDNASTDCEVTTFYFECLEKHLFKALDKFAQFFISPLMKKSAMTREREAIESEFQIAQPKDAYRKEQLLCSLAEDTSPVNTFSWGNLITLRDNVTDEKLYERAHAFRERHYSAHRMTVAIQARLPIEELERYVLECFSTVPSNKLPPDDFHQFAGNVFDTPRFTRIYYIKPTKDVCQVDLTWCLPSLLDKYKSKPHQYVSWLLGDEGKGSLLSILRKKVWALAIFTGNGESGIEHNSLYALFSVSLVLTTEGLAHLTEVISMVYSYIHMLQRIGPQEHLFRELQLIEEVSFRFSVEESSVDLVEELSEAMQFYPPEDYLAGSELYYEYDPEGISMVLNHLVPEKMNISITSKTIPKEIVYDKTEQWFGTQFTDQEIPKASLDIWSRAEPLPEMALPKPNQFLTTDFDLITETKTIPEYPQKILDTNLVEMWYKLDQKFRLPTAHYNFYLITPLSVESAVGQCKMEMMINLLGIQMTEDVYPAQVAELYYSINTNDRGITIKFSGYNQKLPILVNLISTHLKSIKSLLTKELFEAVREKLANGYYNKMIKPTTLSKDVRLSLLLNNYFTPTEKFAVVSFITFDDMNTFCDNFLKNLYIKVLVQGNVEQSVATEVVTQFVNCLGYSPLRKGDYPQFNVLEVPRGEHCCRVQAFNVNDANSIITNYYQSGPFSLTCSGIIELIMMIIEEPLFDILRTKEQLGYHIYCTLRDTFGILGYTITVNTQATKFTTDHVDQRIEKFIKTMHKNLKKMGEKSFNQTKRDLIKMKKCSDVVLQEEVDRNWAEISCDDYMFDRLDREIETIESIKLGDVRRWWETHNKFGGRTEFRKLSIQVVGFDTGISEEKSVLKIKVDKPCASIKELIASENKPTLLLLKSVDTREGNEDYFICDIKKFKKKGKYYPPSPNQRS